MTQQRLRDSIRIQVSSTPHYISQDALQMLHTELTPAIQMGISNRTYPMNDIESPKEIFSFMRTEDCGSIGANYPWYAIFLVMKPEYPQQLLGTLESCTMHR